MSAILKLAKEMAAYYSDTRLIKLLEESGNDILQDIGEEVLNEEGFPEWAKLKDVDYTIELATTYSFEQWAELAKALFNINNVKVFVTNEMYELFLEFIELFDIKMNIKTNPDDLLEPI